MGRNGARNKASKPAARSEAPSWVQVVVPLVVLAVAVLAAAFFSTVDYEEAAALGDAPQAEVVGRPQWMEGAKMMSTRILSAEASANVRQAQAVREAPKKPQQTAKKKKKRPARPPEVRAASTEERVDRHPSCSTWSAVRNPWPRDPWAHGIGRMSSPQPAVAGRRVREEPSLHGHRVLGVLPRP